MIRLALAAGLLLGSAVLASAQTTLRVGDQKGNSQAVMEAAGVLKDVPYKIEWKEFPAAAPLLEALGAGAIETGLVGDAPFTFAAAANVPVKAIAAVRQSRDGLAVLVPEQSPIKSFDDLRGKALGDLLGKLGFLKAQIDMSRHTDLAPRVLGADRAHAFDQFRRRRR